MKGKDLATEHGATSERSEAETLHLSGGNHFDDLRIDIDRAHARQDDEIRDLGKAANRARSIARVLKNRWRFALDWRLQRRNLLHPLIQCGLRHAWFDEFAAYWSGVLRGRPLQVTDFFLLLHDYRKRAQMTGALSWEGPAQHVANWQDTAQLYLTFHYVRKYALAPIRAPGLGALLFPGARALEYGCALAPMYRTYRRYFDHIDMAWVLADLPNFPFHYAKRSYAKDAAIERFLTIRPENFADPLAAVPGQFDLIIAQEILEHVDDPVRVVGQLIDRLSVRGRIVFDFAATNGQGLDTPTAAAKRREALEILARRLAIVKGRFAVTDSGIGNCVGRLAR